MLLKLRMIIGISFCLALSLGMNLEFSGLVAKSYAAEAPLQQAKIQADNLLQQGKFSEAYVAYGQLLREDPTDPFINLGYARAALGAQKPGQAVMAYERLLALYPQESVLLKELAYALSMQNDEQRSSMELAKNKDATTAENAALSAAWNKQHSRTQISGKIRTGLIYDTNVNSGPASNDISLGNLDLSLIDGKAVDSLAGYLGAQLDMGYRLDIMSPWWIVGSTSFYARYNANENLYDLNLSSSEWFSGTIGMRYLGSETLLDIRIKGQIYDYAFLQNVIALGPEVSFAYAISPKIHLISRAQMDHRDYSENHTYDGLYGSVGQYARFFLGDGGHYMTFGARYLGASTQDISNSYDGFEASLDFMFVLPHDIRLAPFVTFSGEYFHGPATALENEHRQDHRLRAGISATIPVSESWNVEIGYQFMQNTSNSELYTYNQHVINAGVAWSF